MRPPESVTEPEKRALMAAYGNTAPLSTVELDHIVSLAAGGAANDPRNLYPEPNYPDVSPDSYYHNPKDILEAPISTGLPGAPVAGAGAGSAGPRLAGGLPAVRDRPRRDGVAISAAVTVREPALAALTVASSVR